MVSRDITTIITACHKVGYRVYPVVVGSYLEKYQLEIEKNRSTAFNPRDRIKVHRLETKYDASEKEWVKAVIETYQKIYNKHIHKKKEAAV